MINKKKKFTKEQIALLEKMGYPMNEIEKSNNEDKNTTMTKSQRIAQYLDKAAGKKIDDTKSSDEAESIRQEINRIQREIEDERKKKKMSERSQRIAKHLDKAKSDKGSLNKSVENSVLSEKSKRILKYLDGGQ